MYPNVECNNNNNNNNNYNLTEIKNKFRKDYFDSIDKKYPQSIIPIEILQSRKTYRNAVKYGKQTRPNGITGGNSKKRSSKKIPVKKASSKKAPLKKPSSKKAPLKKPSSKKTPLKKPSSKKTPLKKPSSKK